MFSRGVWIAVVLGIVALAMVVFLGGGGETARAACGASASSCKTCHEINRKKPVNTNGDWHKQHAMGDYCSFCHGGNVQAQDETGAHAGLVKPFADVQTSCSSCHLDDYKAKAKVYADALGVKVGTGGGGSGGTGGSGGGGSAPTGGANVAPASASGPVLDFNQYYAQYTGAGGLRARDMALIAFAVLIALGFPAIWAFYRYRDRVAAWIRRPRPEPDKQTLDLAKRLKHVDQSTRDHVFSLVADSRSAALVAAALGSLDPELLDREPRNDEERLRLSLSVAQAVSNAAGGAS